MTTINKEKRVTRARKNAQESFERIMGISLKKAKPRHIESWLMHLRDRGLAIATCRTYLSHVRQQLSLITAKKVKAPKREITPRRIFTIAELKTMLAVAKPDNGELLACLLLAGPDILTFQWRWLYDPKHQLPITVYFLITKSASRRGYGTFPMSYWGREDAHWVGDAAHLEGNVWDMDLHTINRRLKSIAKKAGVGTRDVNFTTLKHAHIRLIEKYQDADKAAKALGIDADKKPEETPARKNWQLHGVGRRSFASPVMAKA